MPLRGYGWAAVRFSSTKGRLEFRNGRLTVALACNGSAFGAVTQGQLGATTNGTLSDGSTRQFASFIVLGGVDSRPGIDGGSARCKVKVAEGKIKGVFSPNGLGFFTQDRLIIISDGSDDSTLDSFTKIGD